MEDRPRPVTLTTAGVPGALIYSDDMDEHLARPMLTMTAPADTTLRLRIYVQGPHGARPGPITFRLAAQDQDHGHDSTRSTFSTPEGNGQ
jgi:hypothetical protein